MARTTGRTPGAFPVAALPVAGLKPLDLERVELMTCCSVLELGCGTGLGSITASVMGAASVTASDRENTVLALSDKNMKANIKDESKFRTAKISWGTDMCGPNEEKYRREIGGCWDACEYRSVVRFSTPASAYCVACSKGDADMDSTQRLKHRWLAGGPRATVRMMSSSAQT